MGPPETRILVRPYQPKAVVAEVDKIKGNLQMTQLNYTASLHFGNEKEFVDSFILYYERCSRGQKRLIRYLWHMGRSFVHVFSSQKHMSEEVGFCRTHINRLLKKFKDLGFIGMKRNAYRSSNYFVHDALLKIPLNDPALFTKIRPEVMNIHEPHKQSFPQGKSHNTSHNTSHHSKSTESWGKIRKKDNVGVIFSSDVHRNFVEDEERKFKILEGVPISRSEKQSLMKYSAKAIQRSLDDLLQYSKISSINSWIRRLDSSCQVYTICEQMGIGPNEAWSIYKQGKSKHGSLEGFR